MELGDIFKQDQTNAGARTMASFFAVYYSTLLEAGVPAECAVTLTMDYHWLFTCCTLFKDTGVFPPRS